ncbi:gluconokinase [Corynebacterium tapiri]|uniref:Gluconokinase n=1 Tax=Corynebacterium tapiri TaxID=1448266 RepID=A0A5C4U2P5_9CORY|nr:gluconokinase [Corynebacterium tapiri]TNL95649.1 gluconokinase [Corynebacterium tapiri]
MASGLHIVVMGVSGSGKSTVGELISERLGLPYRDGDDLHPQANIDKMSQGSPLTDEDRWPWLEKVGDWLAERPEGGIIGCSALKRSYRDRIRAVAPDAVFIHVHGDYDLLYSRMETRPGHFMPASLLDSQMATLEQLDEDEQGAVFDVAQPPATVADNAVSWINSQQSN